MPLSIAYPYLTAPLGRFKGDLLQAMALKGQRFMIAKGDLIFREGEPCRGLYLAASCRIKLSLSAPDGYRQTIAILEPGDLFEITPLFGTESHLTTAQALETGLIWFLPRDEVLNLAQAYPEFAIALVRDAFAKTRLLVGLIEGLTMRNVITRLAGLLLQYAQDKGIFTPNGIRVSLDLSQRELASLLGTGREVVSRSLNRLKREGLIRVAYPEVLILDLPGLRRRASAGSHKAS